MRLIHYYNWVLLPYLFVWDVCIFIIVDQQANPTRWIQNTKKSTNMKRQVKVLGVC